MKAALFLMLTFFLTPSLMAMDDDPLPPSSSSSSSSSTMQNPIPPVEKLMFVMGDDSLSIVDMERRRVIKKIKGTFINGFFSLDGEKLYLNYFNSDDETYSLNIFNTQTLKKLNEINLGENRPESVLSVDGKFLYIIEEVGENFYLSMVDAQTLQKMNSIQVGSVMSKIAISPDGKSISLVCIENGKSYIYIIETKSFQVVKTINIEYMAESSVFSPDSTLLFVTASEHGNVSSIVPVFETKNFERVMDIKTGSCPKSIVFSPDNHYIFIVNRYGHTVSVINSKTHEKIKDVKLGFRYPEHGVLSGNEKYLFVMTSEAGILRLCIIDTTTLEQTSDFSYIGKFSLNQDGSQLFVMNGPGHSVSVIDTTTLQKAGEDIPVGNQPKYAVMYHSNMPPIVKELLEAVPQRNPFDIVNLLNRVRKDFGKIPENKHMEVLTAVFTLLEKIQNIPTNTSSTSSSSSTSAHPQEGLPTLQLFFQGAAVSLTEEESKTSQQGFDTAQVAVGNLCDEIRGKYKTYKVTTDFQSLLKRITDLITSHPGLTTGAQKILTFMVLQGCAPALQPQDNTASIQQRLGILHFLAGYLGEGYILPIPGMSEDNRTIHDYIRLLSEGKMMM